MDFRNFSIEELVNKVKTKEVSAKEITQAAIDNIERIDGEIKMPSVQQIMKMLLCKLKI